MIFLPISKFHDKDLFVELIEVYIKIVGACAAIAHKEILPSGCTDLVLKELKDIGVVELSNDVADLESNIGKQLARQFFAAVNFAISHRECIGHELDKLSNRKRAV